MMSCMLYGLCAGPVLQPVEQADVNPPPRNIKEVVDQPQSIHVEVMSSKARVYIKVDSSMVSSQRWRWWWRTKHSFSPHDASKHHFSSLKNDVIPYTQGF